MLFLLWKNISLWTITPNMFIGQLLDCSTFAYWYMGYLCIKNIDYISHRLPSIFFYFSNLINVIYICIYIIHQSYVFIFSALGDTFTKTSQSEIRYVHSFFSRIKAFWFYSKCQTSFMCIIMYLANENLSNTNKKIIWGQCITVDMINEVSHAGHSPPGGILLFHIYLLSLDNTILPHRYYIHTNNHHIQVPDQHVKEVSQPIQSRRKSESGGKNWDPGQKLWWRKVNVVYVVLALSFRSQGSALAHSSSVCSGQGQSDSSYNLPWQETQILFRTRNKELWGTLSKENMDGFFSKFAFSGKSGTKALITVKSIHPLNCHNYNSWTERKGKGFKNHFPLSMS